MPIFPNQYPEKLNPKNEDKILLADSESGSAIKSVQAKKVADLVLPITNDKLADNSVTASQIADGATFKLDGWAYDIDTWTYNSATTFKVGGDKRTTYTKGTRVRFKQGGSYKYGVVIGSDYSSPDTTVTLAQNSDYSISNSAITDNYYSYMANPQGYPTFFNFTPVVTVSSGTAPTYSKATGHFSITGGEITAQYNLQNTSGGTAGSGGGYIILGLLATSPLSVRIGIGAAYNGGTMINGKLILNFLAVTDSSSSSYLSVDGYNILASDQNNANRYIQATVNYLI